MTTTLKRGFSIKRSQDDFGGVTEPLAAQQFNAPFAGGFQRPEHMWMQNALKNLLETGGGRPVTVAGQAVNAPQLDALVNAVQQYGGLVPGLLNSLAPQQPGTPTAPGAAATTPPAAEPGKNTVPLDPKTLMPGGLPPGIDALLKSKQPGAPAATPAATPAAAPAATTPTPTKPTPPAQGANVAQEPLTMDPVKGPSRSMTPEEVAAARAKVLPPGSTNMPRFDAQTTPAAPDKVMGDLPTSSLGQGSLYRRYLSRAFNPNHDWNAEPTELASDKAMRWGSRAGAGAAAGATAALGGMAAAPALGFGGAGAGAAGGTAAAAPAAAGTAAAGGVLPWVGRQALGLGTNMAIGDVMYGGPMSTTVRRGIGLLPSEQAAGAGATPPPAATPETKPLPNAPAPPPAAKPIPNAPSPAPPAQPIPNAPVTPPQPPPQQPRPQPMPQQQGGGRYQGQIDTNAANLERFRGELAGASDPRQRATLERNIRRLNFINSDLTRRQQVTTPEQYMAANPGSNPQTVQQAFKPTGTIGRAEQMAQNARTGQPQMANVQPLAKPPVGPTPPAGMNPMMEQAARKAFGMPPKGNALLLNSPKPIPGMPKIGYQVIKLASGDELIIPSPTVAWFEKDAIGPPPALMNFLKNRVGPAIGGLFKGRAAAPTPPPLPGGLPMGPAMRGAPPIVRPPLPAAGGPPVSPGAGLGAAGAAAGAAGAAGQAPGVWNSPWVRGLRRWVGEPALGAAAGAATGHGADWAAHELGYDNTNFAGPGAVAGGIAGFLPKPWRAAVMGAPVIGSALKGGGGLLGGYGLTQDMGQAAARATLPEQKGKSIFSIRDWKDRLMKPYYDAEAKKIGYNSYDEMTSSPEYGAWQSWKKGGGGVQGLWEGAKGYWNRLTPEQQKNLIWKIGGGVGLLGGGALALGGHPVLGGLAGALGAGALGYGLLAPQGTHQELFDKLSPQQQGQLKLPPKYEWNAMDPAAQALKMREAIGQLPQEAVPPPAALPQRNELEAASSPTTPAAPPPPAPVTQPAATGGNLPPVPPIPQMQVTPPQPQQPQPPPLPPQMPAQPPNTQLAGIQ